MEISILSFRHKDEEKIKKVLKYNNNCKSEKLNFWRLFKPTHLPKLVRENKTIAIETHLELLEPKHRWIFNSKVLRNNFNEELKTIKTPSTSFLFDHCIYALQIRDKGFFIPYHGHRSIYDIYKLNCKSSLTTQNIKKDMFKKHFFMTIEKFNIFEMPS